MPLQDRLLLSNDSTSSVGGIHPDEQVYTWNQPLETSTIVALSSVNVPLFMAKANGRIVDMFVGCAQNAVSASGFVSGSLVGNVRINSAGCLTTNPAAIFAAASAANLRGRSNTTGGTSCVVNPASAYFSQGDQISIDTTYFSAGSAAAGQAALGAYAGVVVRYAAF